MGDVIEGNFQTRAAAQRVSAITDTLLSLDSLVDISLELEIRPKLNLVLSKVPTLWLEYFELAAEAKDALSIFHSVHPHYLEGEGSGDAVRYFRGERDILGFYSREHGAAEQLARTYRHTNQMLKVFDAYLEASVTNRFTMNYVRTSAKLRAQVGRMGSRLAANLGNKENFDEIIEIAATVRPELLKAYRANPKNNLRELF